MITKDFVADTKIVGVTAENDKGTPIQILLSMLKTGDRLIFIREYNNQFDSNAIKVFSQSGQHIGYISKELSAQLSPFLETNPQVELEGIVKEITGGTDGKLYGCNIRIWIQVSGEPSYEDVKFSQEQYKNQSNPAAQHQGNDNKPKNKYVATIIWICIALVIVFEIANIAKSFYKASDSTSKQDPPITVDQIDINFTVLPPDSIGTIWAEATYTNNSQCPISYLKIKALLKDTNTVTYFSSVDTVKPGETSPVFDSFGPESQDDTDIEITQYTIKVHLDDGEIVYVDYDTKLGTYRLY